jgi:ABC-2 type transport system ATP-binding protein
MKQKLGIIQALQHDPELLILDEPTTGLDPLVQEAFYDILHELRDRGKTIFFSSHVLAEVQRLCDRVGVVKDARLVLNTTMSEMANRADRLLWVKLKESESNGSIVEAGNVPPIAKARFIRATGGGWLLYLAAPQDSARIVNELARLQPLDFRFEPAVEEAFLKLYGVTLKNRSVESR